MNIGIFTYGTRGDVQPYIALALGLMEKGHSVTLAAPENFKEFVEGFGIPFHALHGDVEKSMNLPEGQKVMRSENTIKLMNYFFKVLRDMKVPLRQSYREGIDKVNFIIANTATLPILSAIAEKQRKPFVLTYFMPPVVPTVEFPLADFDFLNFPLYNKWTYKIAHFFFWRFVKQEVNEFRQELGLPVLKKNLIQHIEDQKPLDLYCLSPYLIRQPDDWAHHHKITGFLTVSAASREKHPSDQISSNLNDWLAKGEKPIYMGFGSNSVGDTGKFVRILHEILTQTTERILFCTGWSTFETFPTHPRLFIVKHVNHEAILPFCKVGIFHGGAGTLAAMLRNHVPMIIISFYTDQPTWGKIIEKKKLGVHIPLKQLTSQKLCAALKTVQTEKIKKNVYQMGENIKREDGLGKTISEMENFFSTLQKQ